MHKDSARLFNFPATLSSFARLSLVRSYYQYDMSIISTLVGRTSNNLDTTSINIHRMLRLVLTMRRYYDTGLERFHFTSRQPSFQQIGIIFSSQCILLLFIHVPYSRSTPMVYLVWMKTRY
ncbi:uncharacterized protein BO97DRAFT_285539 [Aspergillus homomorphus CBS 101889]|uniref:Uncharacterized protein n=1 Tax=Aspergillus homomorphus (strain CBS 101889) TaxID=1450537 RepID=A0A395HID2_ASPHC|nr:hypothetical protein BO97DRAFT_285539 [Aspergillus homomorphus CBS 101889]RAL06738.1 hypothetical protein BO97DRAFT_285539 [Aspergillus homomorphus CBS 101889]